MRIVVWLVIVMLVLEDFMLILLYKGCLLKFFDIENIKREVKKGFQDLNLGFLV